jgi:uncharacterized protein (UPF0218 family)
LRPQLAKPFGEIVGVAELLAKIQDCRMVIAVGDMVSNTLLESKVIPDIMIFDYKTERGSYHALKAKVEAMSGATVEVKNPAGVITQDLVREIKAALNRGGRTRIKVEGEEDLAALVCAALAPDDACMVYGLPKRGIVLLRIDADAREKARSFIYDMEELN